MILAVTVSGKPSAYREHEVLDDLSARAMVATLARQLYLSGGPQSNAMGFINAHRAGRPYVVDAYTFTLITIGDPT